MTTQMTGKVIPNYGVNLTAIGSTVLAVNTWVTISADYTAAAVATRGDLETIGYILVGNAAAGDDVSIATRGKSVEVFEADGAISAGDAIVAAGATNTVASYDPTASPGSADSCCSIIGWALQDAADGEDLDVLVK